LIDSPASTRRTYALFLCALASWFCAQSMQNVTYQWLLTRTLAAELREQGVSAVLVDPGDMRTGMHQEAFPGQDISDRPLPEVTVPFWNWLFYQDPDAVRGGRLAAQHEDARWLQQV